MIAMRGDEPRTRLKSPLEVVLEQMNVFQEKAWRASHDPEPGEYSAVELFNLALERAKVALPYTAANLKDAELAKLIDERVSKALDNQRVRRDVRRLQHDNAK